MREIKFRGWDGEKMIFYPEWFTKHERSTLCFEEPPYIHLDDDDIDKPGSIELMQYTGLKDKNGKEIYEGDIVEKAVDSFIYKGVVKFGEHHLANNDDDYIDHPATFGFYIGVEGELKQAINTSCKVIGNIYENPELLPQ